MADSPTEMADINSLKQWMEPQLPLIENATVGKRSVATAVHDAASACCARQRGSTAIR